MVKKLEDLDLTPLIKKIVTPKFLEDLGGLVVSELRKNTRLGFGVSGYGESQQKLEKLAASTIKKRQRLKRRGELSKATSPSRSNLTQSGELLDSIEFRVVGKEVEVYINGERNNAVAAYVSAKRPFFNLSKPVIRVLSSFIEKELNNKLRAQQ